MGKGGARRATPARSSRRFLPHLALPVGLLVVIGVLAVASPALRDESAADTARDAAAIGKVMVGQPPASDAAAPLRTGSKRAAPRFHQFKPNPVEGLRLEEIPAVRPGYVKVHRRETLPTGFTVASWNVLGAGHTGKGGTHAGFADGATRVRWAAAQLQAHGVTVAGLQEFQITQAGPFLAASPGWTAYPGASGGRQGVQNSIAWDTGVWTMVEGATTPIPYFGGTRMPMPHVLLENNATGQRVWFANFHNPADAHGPAERWRDLATSIEIGLFNTLQQSHPLVVTGDFNEREEYPCRVGAAAGLHTADVPVSTCRWDHGLGVDWILGSSDIGFSGYLRDESAWARRTSDHPLHVSDAAVAPRFRAKVCMPHRWGDPVDVLWCPPAG